VGVYEGDNSSAVNCGGWRSKPDRRPNGTVNISLRDVPEDWRKVLLLHYGEDEPLANVAESTGKTEEEVRRIVRYSRKYLQQRLVETGCVLNPARRAA
jgi:DNA-directed RNA polymerase specialized sigma24 family protein